MRTHRTFDGRRFDFRGAFAAKRKAQDAAQEYRDKGYYARIVWDGRHGRHCLYVSETARRPMNRTNEEGT